MMTATDGPKRSGSAFGVPVPSTTTFVDGCGAGSAGAASASATVLAARNFIGSSLSASAADHATESQVDGDRADNCRQRAANRSRGKKDRAAGRPRHNSGPADAGETASGVIQLWNRIHVALLVRSWPTASNR